MGAALLIGAGIQLGAWQYLHAERALVRFTVDVDDEDVFVVHNDGKGPLQLSRMCIGDHPDVHAFLTHGLELDHPTHTLNKFRFRTRHPSSLPPGGMEVLMRRRIDARLDSAEAAAIRKAMSKAYVAVTCGNGFGMSTHAVYRPTVVT